MDQRKAFFVGIILHLFLIWTRIQIFPFHSFGCIQKDCSSIIIADIPFSIIYLAFSDPVLIVFSLIFGSILWGFYFWLFYRLLNIIFKS